MDLEAIADEDGMLIEHRKHVHQGIDGIGAVRIDHREGVPRASEKDVDGGPDGRALAASALLEHVNTRCLSQSHGGVFAPPVHHDDIEVLTLRSASSSTPCTPASSLRVGSTSKARMRCGSRTSC